MAKSKRVTTSGNTLEQTVKTILKEKRFEIVKYSAWKKNPEQYSNELLLTNAPFETIYKHKGKTEYLLKSEKHNLEIRIECKWQQVAGSVDEKLPYLYLNAIETMPEKHILVLIDGDGWKKGSIQWLKNSVAEKKYTTATNKNKIIEVLSLKEFITWANKILR